MMPLQPLDAQTTLNLSGKWKIAVTEWTSPHNLRETTCSTIDNVTTCTTKPYNPPLNPVPWSFSGFLQVEQLGTSLRYSSNGSCWWSKSFTCEDSLGGSVSGSSVSIVFQRKITIVAAPTTYEIQTHVINGTVISVTKIEGQDDPFLLESHTEGVDVNGVFSTLDISGTHASGAVAIDIIPTATGADLSITKDGSPNPVVAGEQLVYTLTAANGGPSDSSGVVVTDQLPPGVTFVSATSTSGTCSELGGLVTCTVEDLPSGEFATVTITVTVDPSSTGTIMNTTSVLGNETDPFGDNNIQSQTTSIGVRLTVVVKGFGLVFVDPPGTPPVSICSPPACTQIYPLGTPVALIASPVQDFVKWDRDCDDTPRNVCVIWDMDEDKVVVATFKSTQPVNIKTPEGNVVWGIDKNGHIGWVPGARQPSRSVKIELTRDGGITFETLFASTPDDREEDWTVTGPPTDLARIRVSNVGDPSITGTSGLFTICDESDGDNVCDDVENLAPNTGDGNNDGIPDSTQANVASLPNAVDGSYVTLVSLNGTSLAGVRAVENPSPRDVPAAVAFPVGLLEFMVNSIFPGGSATVQLLLPSGIAVDTYYKFGPTPADPADHWYEFLFDGTTGAEIVIGTVSIHFVDGQHGDDDLSSNGQIVEPGAPAVAQ